LGSSSGNGETVSFTEVYVYPEKQVRKTYKEFDEETDRLLCVHGMGIAKGEHVAIGQITKEST
jgi:hypothetical protein